MNLRADVSYPLWSISVISIFSKFSLEKKKVDVLGVNVDNIEVLHSFIY